MTAVLVSPPIVARCKAELGSLDTRSLDALPVHECFSDYVSYGCGNGIEMSFSPRRSMVGPDARTVLAGLGCESFWIVHSIICGSSCGVDLVRIAARNPLEWIPTQPDESIGHRTCQCRLGSAVGPPCQCHNVRPGKSERFSQHGRACKVSLLCSHF
jgi:hypothetical protein